MLFLCLTSASEYAERTDGSGLEEYISDMAQGSREALAALYERTRVSVYSFALSILKNTQDAEDAMHDCYLDLWNAAGVYKPEGKPMAWVLTVVRNRCFMRLRERKKHADLSEDGGRLPAHPDTALEVSDRLLVQACLERLSDEERRIVILHAVSGLKHRETAELMELPLATVLSKYHRALKKLKAYIKEGERS